MKNNARSQFSSKFGFIMAAAGSAVGLGNIWGFPTQTASNGGAAFLFVYLAMVCLLAYPMLVAELTIGRYGQSNPINAIKSITQKNKLSANILGLIGMIVVSLILSFYSIVAGWLIGSMLNSVFELIGMKLAAQWVNDFSIARNLLLMLIFIFLTTQVVKNGVHEGIERWSSRLMPMLLFLFIVLIGYIFTQEGAIEGLDAYLVPDFSLITPTLLVNALGQSFFSLSLGVCVIMVYGSYLSKDVNIPKTAAQVAFIDTGVAIAAGLLIIPAMYVAKHNGVEIFAENGELLSSDTLVFNVLPNMFDTMGTSGIFASIIFFILMIIAALTSSISMLEVPVSCAIEQLNQKRSNAVMWISSIIVVFSSMIVFFFEELFSFVIKITTVYSQPLLGLSFALLVGWVWNRNSLLNELKKGYPEIEKSWFWKIWPTYVKIICPFLIFVVFLA